MLDAFTHRTVGVFVLRALAASLLVLLWGTDALAAVAKRAPAAPKTPAASGRIPSAIQAYAESLARVDAFAGSILLANGDQVLVRRAYGLASRRFLVPNRPDTKFNIASINKLFTQIAVQDLADRDALRLDDTIDRYLPDYPKENAEKITVRMLVEHRAGVPDVFGKKYAAVNHARIGDVKGWMSLIRDEPLEFTPGTRQQYSNGGYVLLGAVIEKVSGETYYDYVRAHVCKPAGMNDTEFYELDQSVKNLATGYTREGSPRWRENTPTLPGRGSPAGGGYSTADDLFSLAKAIRDGRLGFKRGATFRIAGGAPGANAVFDVGPEWTLVVLSNMDPPSAERIARRFQGLVKGAGTAPPTFPAESVPPTGAPPAAAPTPENAPPTEPEEPEEDATEAARPDRDGQAVSGQSSDPGRKPTRTALPPEGVDVAMGYSEHLPTVEVRVNGKGPFRFGIDTGGEGTARVTASLAQRLGLPRVGKAFAGDPSGRNRRSTEVVSLESIEVGGARFTGLRATVRREDEPDPGPGVDGILGFGLFADCLVTLDYPLSRVRLGRGELPPENGDDILPFRDEHGIPAVSLRVGTITMQATIDAGFQGGISLPESLAAHLPLAGTPRVIGRARTVSNEFEVKAADLRTDVVLGGMVLRTPTVEFQPIFPMANLGARFLRDMEITFDQRNHRLKLRRVS